MDTLFTGELNEQMVVLMGHVKDAIGVELIVAGIVVE